MTATKSGARQPQDKLVATEANNSWHSTPAHLWPTRYAKRLFNIVGLAMASADAAFQ